MYRGEKKERQACIRLIVRMLENMNILMLREVLEAVLAIAKR